METPMSERILVDREVLLKLLADVAQASIALDTAVRDFMAATPFEDLQAGESKKGEEFVYEWEKLTYAGRESNLSLTRLIQPYKTYTVAVDGDGDVILYDGKFFTREQFAAIEDKSILPYGIVDLEEDELFITITISDSSIEGFWEAIETALS